MARHKKKKTQEHLECQNDGTVLVGDFCYTCGQRADEPRRAVIGLVQDVFVDTLAIDGKLARTILLLLTRPGVLARRYLDGKRMSYSPPFRLYLFMSVFFFIAVFGLINFDDIDIAPADLKDELAEELASQDTASRAETLETLEHLGIIDVTPGEEEGEDSIAVNSIPFAERKWDGVDADMPAWLEPYAEQLFYAAQRVTEDPRLFISESRQNLPRMLLLAPVLYALTLILFYIYRRKFYVYDHIVTSLYMHAALYAYLLLAIIMSFIPVLKEVLFIPIVWGMLQPVLSLRQVYGSKWISAIPKSILMSLIYIAGLVMFVTLGLTYSLYQS